MKVYNPSDTLIVSKGRQFPGGQRVTVRPADEPVAQHLVDAGRLVLVRERKVSVDVPAPTESPKRGGKKRVRDTSSHTSTPTNESEA